ncbi:MAG: helix-turn-helix transcriptional regulator [Lachnospiraceae bacterium]|nr:helix-turn-helix transcriptional regulator [Lachnospiraceae bacterium]
MKNRIKKIRKELDLTQQEFADRLGVKRNTISTYESGRSVPIDAVISLICREFKINEEWLRTGKGQKEQPEPKSELDKLAEKYNMSHDEYIFLEMYFKKKRSERDAIFQFLRDTFSAINADEAATKETETSATYQPSYNSSEELSDEEVLRRYHKGLELERQVEEKSEAS